MYDFTAKLSPEIVYSKVEHLSNIDEVTSQQICQHSSYASTAATLANEGCISTAYYASFMQARLHCQHSRYGSMTSTAAILARLHCQNGSIASTSALAYQHGNYASMAARLLFTLYDWLWENDWQQNDDKLTKNMVLCVAHALHSQLKIGILQTTNPPLYVSVIDTCQLIFVTSSEWRLSRTKGNWTTKPPHSKAAHHWSQLA